MNYVMVEYTPGYMPDSDDPAIFDLIEDAKEYLKSEVERLCEFHDENGDTFEVTWDRELTHAYVIRTGKFSRNDLGRVFDIVESGEASNMIKATDCDCGN